MNAERQAEHAGGQECGVRNVVDRTENVKGAMAHTTERWGDRAGRVAS